MGTSQQLHQYLFPDDEINVFAVLDGASVPDLLAQLHEHQPDHVCLYRGELEPGLAEAAPYLIQLKPNFEFSNWLIENGQGKHWGIFAQSYADLRTLRRHFRSFLTVHDERGRPLLFRYYDPRVMRKYLPTCNAKELALVFGSVESYLVEDEDAVSMLRFTRDARKLRLEKKRLSDNN
jgi:hypothetical protein